MSFSNIFQLVFGLVYMHKCQIFQYFTFLFEQRYGLLCLEFYDTIQEGNGERIIRCWKFLLLHFKADGKGSTKYALEGLYLILQVHALLSPRQAYRLIWN